MTLTAAAQATTDNAADGRCQFCQVSWRCSVEATIHEHGQFVLDALQHPQPVKVHQERCNVVVGYPKVIAYTNLANSAIHPLGVGK